MPSPPAVCVVDGCDNPVLVKSRGWCRRHYCRWQRHGNPTAGQAARDATALERFMHYAAVPADQSDPAPCWPWGGAVVSRERNRDYGIITVDDGSQMLAHRWAYSHFVGPIPADFVIDHVLRCRTPNCVSPHHLEAVTQAENIARGLRANALTGTCRADKHAWAPGARRCAPCRQGAPSDL